ncbi:MAG: hypothetical protein Q9212_002462 [Teloschistes hypoglaucus]
MDQWLDSLSEDWVSQPVSPRSDHPRRSSSALSAVSSTSNASQSRIPRYRSLTRTSLSPNGATFAKRHSSGPVAQEGKIVLKERSSSNLNVSRNRVTSGVVESKGSAAEKKIRNKQRAPSSAAASTAQDTIQHKPSGVSPTKENDPGSTPEWRRRVLQGKSGAAGPDLFGPIGLESMFKPPTVGRASKPGGKQRGAKKFQPATVDEFPSSPPPFPSDLGSVERSGGTEKRRSSLLKQMEILEEVSEGDSRVSLPRKDRDEIREALLSPATGSMKAMPSAMTEEDHDEVLSQVLLPKNHLHDQSPAIGAAGQLEGPPEVQVDSPESERGSLRIHEDNLPSSASASPSTSAQGATPASDWTSHSLPDDLSTGTDLYVANGGFVNMRRGGYSNEGSFQRRPLSPSSLPDFDAPELRSPSPGRRKLSIGSRRSKAQDSSVNEPLPAPVTPRRQQHRKSNSAGELQSSGSPLKLFDKHDTFTNERLIRRISKFEQSTHESETDLQEENPKATTSVPAEEGGAIPQDARHFFDKTASKSHRRISNFGAGQLDSYPFQTNHPLEPKAEPTTSDIRGNAASDHQEAIFRSHKVTVESRYVDDVDVQIDVVQTVNGKRLPYSPAKETWAKRRRTLQSSDEPNLEISQQTQPTDAPSANRNGEARVEAASVHTADAQAPTSRSIAGKRTKNTREDDDNRVADSKVQALRHILQPSSATPRQPIFQSSADVSKLIMNMGGANDEAESLGIDLDHQTQALAGELATFTLNMAQDMTQGQRKASVTTADFFNEAKEIMKLIRNQGRPPSSQDIAEEPEDDESESRPNNFEESTVEEFSRPPSREGGSLRQLREPAVMNARVASHLRKFEDTDDLGLALPSSAKSIHINQSHDPSLLPGKGTSEELMNESSEIMSDPPNIRIRAVVQGTEIDLHHKVQEVTGNHIPSSGSQNSSDPSTGRSVPTGSSRGSQASGTRAVIGPQVVSHLLSDTMGTMTFDHNKQVWVKRRSSRASQTADAHSRSGSDVTENLFQDIPDLSVDELEELQRTERGTTSVKILGSASDQISSHDHLSEHPVGVQLSRPPARDSTGTETVDQSSAPSKSSQIASSGVPETRATSWADQVTENAAINVKIQVNNNKTLGAEGNEHNEEVEHEISILEGRTSATPRHVRHIQRQPRVVTVAFSSPLVDRVETLKGDSDTTESDDDGSDLDLDLADSPVQDGARSSSTSHKQNSAALGKRSTYRGASRRASIGFARPMSRVDENEELTFLQSFHGPANASMDLVVTTPLATSRSVLLQSAFSSAQASSIGFQLSPLSEFTIHKDDRPAHRDVSRAVRHRGLLATHEVEGQLSLAVQDLVKKLTDLEPYEPYWDYIRHVDLRNRNLHSLHMLDEFCGHIENLDVSDNELGQLEGAPQSIRHLKARNNCLSNLVSWAHLHNLQYLDVSGNQIQSLVGFQSLIHLRELRADDNQIENLNGILELDGLMKVTLRNNHVLAADFEGCNLAHLTHLDLRHNQLNEVINLDQLPALRHLDLSQNYLKQISFPPASGTLQHLQLADNQLCTLDIGPIHRLKYLDIDRNTIPEIANIATHTSLGVLSWREQRLSVDQSGASIHYEQCHNVRELYLSGNILRTFAPDKHLLSLQHLELASTGLQSLSGDFGLKCPNVQVLNLNFNAVTELRPLLGIVKLQKLYLAGNRVSRLRRTASVFDRIGLELTEIDLRQNPLTLGYYNSQQQSANVAEKGLIVAGKNSTAPRVEDDLLEGMEKCAAYLLPRIDPTVDDAAQNRLDEDTSTRRRVYEMLISLRCKNLQRLDGVSLDRRKIASRDGVWERLRELGVITYKTKDGALELQA